MKSLLPTHNTFINPRLHHSAYTNTPKHRSAAPTPLALLSSAFPLHYIMFSLFNYCGFSIFCVHHFGFFLYCADIYCFCCCFVFVYFQLAVKFAYSFLTFCISKILHVHMYVNIYAYKYVGQINNNCHKSNMQIYVKILIN